MPGYDISSTSNPQIKRLVKLRDRSHRDREGVFVVEGRHLVEMALGSGHVPTEVYLDGTVPYGGPGATYTVEPSVLSRASYRRRSQGLLALFPHIRHDLDQLEPRRPALVLVAEDIEKPGNLGAILRTADATGSAAVIMLGRGTDPFNPNVVRASRGALFTVPVAKASHHELAVWLDAHGVNAVAASPDIGTLYWDVDLTGPVALMVGSEKDGLSGDALSLARHVVALPMAGSVDSLNASVSHALLAYEAVRQRR